jgi:trans-aconitate methyltransferase
MLGKTLDYWLLKSLAHRRNLATEAELDARAVATSPQAFGAQMPKMEKLVRRFGSHLPIDAHKSYLDMGCGTGELTLALAGMGAGRITGVDFLPRSIETARAHAARVGVANAQFVCADLHRWVPPEKYDVLLSFDAFEHIDEPRVFLRRMKQLAAPGGLAVVSFGPLFHSPFGDHMSDFFRVQLPWRGVLFSEDAMLRVRRECFRPTDPARRLKDIAGGLNRMRYSEFIGHVSATGWEFDYLAVNTFLREGSVSRRASDALASVPGVRDLIPHNVYAVLKPT